MKQVEQTHSSLTTSDPSPGHDDLTPSQVFRRLLSLYLISVLIRTLLNRGVEGMTIYTDEWLQVDAARSVLEWKGTYWGQVPTYLPGWLYPLLMAPLLKALEWERAFGLIQAVNALVICLAIFPSYGLARELLGRRQGLLVALLVALMPAMGYCMKTMTENPFFPLMMLSFWLMFRAIRRPTAGRCLAAGLIAGLSFHAKPQALLLPMIIAATVIVHELFEFKDKAGRPLPERLSAGARRVLMHGLTAVGWLAALAPRLAQTALLEQRDDPFSIRSLLGFYYGIGMKENTLDPAYFVLVTLNNLCGWVIATGVLPAWLLGVGLLGLFDGRIKDPRERLLLLMTGIAVAGVLCLSGRHIVLEGDVPILYERFYFVVLPLTFVTFIVYMRGVDQNAPRDLFSVTQRLAVGVLVLLFFLLTIHVTPWILPSNTPSLAGGLMMLGWRDIHGGLILAYLLTTAAALGVFLWAGMRFRRLVAGLIVLLLSYNIGWYGVHVGYTNHIIRREMSIASRIAHKLTREDRLLVLRDGLDPGVASQAGYQNHGTTVHFRHDPLFWYASMIEVGEDGTVATYYDPERSWLLASHHWRFNREPEMVFEGCRLYRMGGERPLRMMPTQVAAYRGKPRLPNEITPASLFEQLELSYVETRLPKVWKAGEVHRIRVRLRSDNFFFFSGYVGQLALGYHWSKPEQGGNWEAVIWDDGRHGLIQNELMTEETYTIDLDVKAPDAPHDRWLLTLSPLIINDESRKFSVRGELDQLHWVRVEE